MTTTVNVSAQGLVELPREFCKRKNIKPGSAVRVTEVGDGVYVTPLPEPTEKELKDVIALAGSIRREQSPEEEALVHQEVAAYRAEKRRKRA